MMICHLTIGNCTNIYLKTYAVYSKLYSNLRHHYKLITAGGLNSISFFLTTSGELNSTYHIKKLHFDNLIVITNESCIRLLCVELLETQG